MGSEFPPLDGYSCLETLGIMTTSLDDLVQCVESEQGELLLHEIGEETLNLNPPLTGVPWLLFNDVRFQNNREFNETQRTFGFFICTFQEFTMDNWIDGMNDLKGLLCTKYLSDTDKCL